MLKTISEVKETGWNALVERLGVAGATLLRFESLRRLFLCQRENFFWSFGSKLRNWSKMLMVTGRKEMAIKYATTRL